MDEREYLPLSWLSQADYCLRRAAFLLNERVWIENSDTAKGRAEHERVHTQRIEKHSNMIKLYEYNVFSDNLGIIGKCDCIEATQTETGCILPCATFSVNLFPIEYKHGSVREEEEYKIQLCAQAMCLEEMYHTNIKEGALFFISSHRRLNVSLTEALRLKVCDIVNQLRDVRNDLIIPAADYSARCKRCSLRDYCMPKLKHSAKEYCKTMETEARSMEAEFV